MFHALALWWLLLIFAAGATAVWVAGEYLSDATDILSKRFGLGQAVGGAVLLAVATNLPELAITATAAWQGHLEIAVGNILGGIAIQTVVLVALDLFGVKGKSPLTTRAASLSLALEGLLVIAVLSVAVMGTRVPKSLALLRLTPQVVLIAGLWVLGIWLVGRARSGLPWTTHDEDKSADRGTSKSKKDEQSKSKGHGTTREVLIFLAAAAVTLVAGWTLETSGDAIAAHIGMTGALFAATVLAASTSLPELSTGLTSVKLGDHQLAVSDILGGNAFLPVLFLLATLVSGKPVLPLASGTDVYLAGLGILLTVPYLYGLIFRPKRKVLGMGWDSLAVLLLYAVGMGGLYAITRGG